VPRSAVVVVTLVVAATACGGSAPPKWLRDEGHRALRGFLIRPQVESETYVVKKHRAFAIYDLRRKAWCGGCSHPSGAQLPCGDALSLAFDVRTRRLTDMTTCDVRTECPETQGFEALRR
jgi:hypothetical protein